MGGIIYVLVCAGIAYLIIVAGQTMAFPLYGVMQWFGQSLTEGGNTFWGAVLESAALYALFVGVWIVGLLVLLIWKNNRYILKKLWYGGGNTFRNLLIGLFVGFAMNMFCIVLAMLHGDIHVYFNAFNPMAAIFLFIMVFIQSAGEEMAFRGYFYYKILERYPKSWAAILISGLLFGAIHISNDGSTFFGILSCALSGIFFAQMVCYFDSIWCAFGAHAAWNFTQNFLMGLPNSGNVVPYSIFKLDAANARDSFFYSTSFGPEGSMTSVIIHFIGIILLFYWFEIRKKKAE